MSQDRLSVGRQAASAAAQLTLQYFQTDQFDVERKGDNSPVTIADKSAESLLRQEISAAFPDDAIVGEEHQDKPGTSGYQWILDPIDGTKSFISGVPLYGTLVGLLKDDEPVMGIIEIPGLDERVFAAKGEGAWHQRGSGQETRCQVAPIRSISDGVFLATAHRGFIERGGGAEAVFHHFSNEAYIARTWGDCYGYLLVATGRAHLMIDPLMNIWDAAALLPVMTEAGGVFTDWNGQPTVSGGEGIATTTNLLPDVLKITRPFSKSSWPKIEPVL